MTKPLTQYYSPFTPLWMDRGIFTGAPGGSPILKFVNAFNPPGSCIDNLHRFYPYKTTNIKDMNGIVLKVVMASN